MANFKIKNGLQAGRYLLNSSTLSGSTIDLSLASVFSTTLSSDPAYTFTNPPPSGTAAAFSVEVTGGTTTFTQDSFDTTLYTGNGGTQTITNGIDLAGDGGLVWTKIRNVSNGHQLFDTARGGSHNLESNTTAGNSGGMSVTFNSNGFTLGNSSSGNFNGNTLVAWTFKEQAKFFDIVTYTGNGASSQTISHNLGTTVGMIVVKRYDTSGEGWEVYHKGVTFNAGNRLWLNLTNALTTGSGTFSSAPTSTEFYVGPDSGTNASGGTYVAYLFAHDTASDSLIKCGSYTGNGAADGPEVNLGWSPQWILVKNADTAYGWIILDTKRGIAASPPTANVLFANTSAAEDPAGNRMHFTSTGFKITTSSFDYNKSGDNFIYMAIRGDSATDSAITWPSSVKWPSGLAPTTPAAGTKDLFTFLTTDGGTTYYGKKAGSDIA